MVPSTETVRAVGLWGWTLIQCRMFEWVRGRLSRDLELSLEL